MRRGERGGLCKRELALRWQSVVPRCLPNLRSFNVTSLKHDLAVPVINAYSEENCSRGSVGNPKSFRRRKSPRPLSECQSTSRKIQHIILFLIFFSFLFFLCLFFFFFTIRCTGNVRVYTVRLSAVRLVRFSASLSGRKPRAFGSYMKYEGKSRWKRIVRPCVCRWNQCR